MSPRYQHRPETYEHLKKVATSHWYRIRHKDGRYLHMSGEGWVPTDLNSYLGNTAAAGKMQEASETLSETEDWYLVDVTREVRGRA